MPASIWGQPTAWAAPAPTAQPSIWGGPQYSTQQQQQPTFVDPTGNTNHDSKNTTISTSTVKPWDPQGDALKKLYASGQANYDALQKQGPIGFDPTSLMGLQRMQRLASGPNSLIDNATGAVGNIASGQQHIGTGGMFYDVANGPGITTGGRFAGIADGPGISTNGFSALYNDPGVDTRDFGKMFTRTASGQGALNEGIFGNIARGGQLSVYPQYTSGEVGPDGDGNIAMAGGGGAGGGGGGGPPEDPRLRGIPAPRSDPNPYRSAALDNALSRTMDQIKASASAGGRYGSSAFVDQAARGLGDVASNFNLNAYNADQDRMMQAAQAQDQSSLARQGLALQAASGLAGVQGQNAATRLAAVQGGTGVQNQNIQNRLAATQGLTGVQGQNIQDRLAAIQGMTGVQGQNIANRMQAAGMAPAMNDLRYADAQKLIGIGGAREEQAKQAQMFGTQNLQNWSGLIGGIPGAAGTTTNQVPKAPWWQTLFGGALAGLGGLGGIFGGGG